MVHVDDGNMRNYEHSADGTSASSFEDSVAWNGIKSIAWSEIPGNSRLNIGTWRFGPA